MSQVYPVLLHPLRGSTYIICNWVAASAATSAELYAVFFYFRDKNAKFPIFATKITFLKYMKKHSIWL